MRLRSRKKVFLGLVALLICLILAGTAIFYYWEYYETPVEKWDEAKYSKSEDYIEKQTDKGILIENQKAGISFVVPEGWRVEKEEGEDHVALFSYLAEGTLMMQRGCKITVEAQYIKTNLRAIEDLLRKAHKEWGYIDEYEIVSMGKRQALKNTTGIASLEQFGTGVHVPVRGLVKNRLYYLGLSANVRDKDDCTQEFEEFLKTVIIK